VYECCVKGERAGAGGVSALSGLTDILVRPRDARSLLGQIASRLSQGPIGVNRHPAVLHFDK